ncbi:MAG: hypothetical protein V4555_05300 [Acidobacteriota bacterium]
MQLSNEVQQLIRSTIAVKEEQLIRQLQEERRDIAARLAAKGLVSSSTRIHQDIDAIESFITKRMAAHVDSYLDVLLQLGIKVDLLLEAEIVRDLEGIANSGRHAVPPAISMSNQKSMLEAYKVRLGQADKQALAHGKNRVRLVRLKDAQPPDSPQLAVVHNHSYTAKGSNARINVDSTDNSSNVVRIDVPEMLDLIVQLSKAQGSPEIQQAAGEAKAAYPDKSVTATKIAAWVSLASSSAHLMHQALPYLTDIYHWLGI